MGDQKRKGLGRGLSALIGDVPSEVKNVVMEEYNKSENDYTKYGVKMVGVERLSSGKYQPRQRFSEDGLESLANSLKQNGVLQPILVRPLTADTYEIIAGERRWRAAKKAGMEEVPVLIRAFKDSEALEIAIVENVQRTDLNALEESEAYHRLMQEFHYTQEKLAKTLGKSRSHIANMLRLTAVSELIAQLLREEKITAGHARALIGFAEADTLALRIVKEDLSVRMVERYVSEYKKKTESGHKSQFVQSSNIDRLEEQLADCLGMRVNIKHNHDRGKGKINITYNSLEQFDSILEILKHTK